MKYGESVFDIFYLLFAVVIGILILRKAKDQTEHSMGAAVLILGLGDAFHLIPRVLNYLVDSDFTAALGIGKLVTSVTMTVFYVLLYRIGCAVYKEERPGLKTAVYVFAVIRVVLCLFPQNGWFQNSSSMLWGVLRNIPFVILGILTILLFYRNRKQIKHLRHIWLWILLSFAFYIPVAVFAGVLPMLGMLMLPKTICYMAMIIQFYRETAESA